MRAPALTALKRYLDGSDTSAAAWRGLVEAGVARWTGYDASQSGPPDEFMCSELSPPLPGAVRARGAV